MKREVLLGLMLPLILILGTLSLRVCKGQDLGILSDDFYQTTCPDAKKIARNITWDRAASNPALGAKLLRMQFHDCFVRGCDASILLDPIKDEKVEKDVVPNQSLSGYDVIDNIKAELEKVCPGVVSCADILALAARDAVSFPFKRLLWKVQTGRRDGVISLATEADNQLPSPFANFETLKKQFVAKKLNVTDLVVLSGAHSLGVAHCATFADARLYKFSPEQETDPSLDPSFAETLKSKCPNPSSADATVEMDNESSLTFDNSYYANLLANKGVLLSDVALLKGPMAANIVTRMSKNRALFFTRFGQSMMKMGAMDVLTGDVGQIRENCRRVNE